MPIVYQINPDLTVPAFRDLLLRSGLAARRPIDDESCLQGMLVNSNLLVAAFDKQALIGIARSVTDFTYACYLSDLAVDQRYQKNGIGREMQKITRKQLGPKCKIILLSAPAATDYYPKLGYERHENCWVLKETRELSTGE